jgi:hypothetical protein
MRKVTFVKPDHPIRKLMVYASPDSVYLFLYDAVDDRPCIVGLTFNAMEEVEQHCQETYDADKNDWILISDPLPDCQDDFIRPIRIKGREAGDPKWGQFQYFNGQWVDISPSGKYLSFAGMSENECLFVTGLLDEFDHAKKHDQSKVFKILFNLGLPVSTHYLL